MKRNYQERQGQLPLLPPTASSPVQGVEVRHQGPNVFERLVMMERQYEEMKQAYLRVYDSMLLMNQRLNMLESHNIKAMQVRKQPPVDRPAQPPPMKKEKRKRSRRRDTTINDVDIHSLLVAYNDRMAQMEQYTGTDAPV